MTTDKDLCMHGQSVPVVFTTKGIDITPNKDQGVYKVLGGFNNLGNFLD